MKKLFKQPFFVTFILSLSILVFIICSYVFGWTLPQNTYQNYNLSSPINTSSNAQYKVGYLAVGTSTAPSFPLDVTGVIRIGRYSSAPSGANGALYYDTSSNKFKGYQSGSWSDFGGSATELWSTSGSNIYYNSGKVGIGTSTPSYTLTVVPPTGSAYDISICKNGVCCPIWKDCDNDGKTYGNGDCDESCATCYVGSAAYTTSPDGKDQDCDGTIDEGGSIRIYMSNTTYNGNLGGRSGADSKCDLGTTLGCDVNRAFISVNFNDEIQDMPTNYGIPTNVPIYWYNRSNSSTLILANNWADMLDGTIINSQQAGTGVANYAWTGSTANGFYNNSANCYSWTDSTTNTRGVTGDYATTDSNWLSRTAGFMYCCDTYFVRCLCSVGYQ